MPHGIFSCGTHFDNMKKILCFLFISFIAVNIFTPKASADNLSYAAQAVGLDVYCDYLKKQNYEETITVAVVDSGVAEIDCFSGKLVDGYDFIDDDNDATNDTSSDSHGTIVASIISDITDGLPIKIMPVRILENRSVQIKNLVAGIKYAVDNGADVINLSVGGSASDCSEIDLAIAYAYSNNVTVVAAAGNERRNIADCCPAHNESAITVSSVDFGNVFAGKFSNYGELTDCCAPGVDLVGFNADGMPKTVSGTSFSAAVISAGAAMLKLEHPEYSADDIQNQIKSVCIDLGESGADKYYGFGLPEFSKFIKSSVSISDYDLYNNSFIDYKVTLELTAKVINAPENSEVLWFVNNNQVGKGDSFAVEKAKENFAIQVRLVEDGEIISESPILQIYVKNSFFDKLIYFIKNLFACLTAFFESALKSS